MVQEELSHGKIGSSVTHQTAAMARMENPGNRFCQAVGRIDDIRDVNQFQVAR